MTALTFGAADVQRVYHGRANCKNRIRELKYDYEPDRMNQSDFDRTENVLLLMTIAYNFLSFLNRIAKLCDTIQSQFLKSGYMFCIICVLLGAFLRRRRMKTTSV
ncbi:MAG: hypothetical protein LBD27_08290 [Tannerella sp.]|nr:hypothetical protein [Tannerella sp.]